MPRPSFEEIQDFYRNSHKAPRRRRIRAVAASARSWMADNQSAAEKGLDAVIVEVNPQTLSDQL